MALLSLLSQGHLSKRRYKPHHGAKQAALCYQAKALRLYQPLAPEHRPPRIQSCHLSAQPSIALLPFWSPNYVLAALARRSRIRWRIHALLFWRFQSPLRSGASALAPHKAGSLKSRLCSTLSLQASEAR